MASAGHPDSGYSNPVRLAVATRESSQRSVNADAGPSKLTERDTLLRAKKRNEEVRRKGEKWADKLMEETVDRETFKRALRYIHPSQYDLITHERHLNTLCSYPLCSHPPAAPYKPGKRFRISTTNRSITEVDGNKEDGFCSKACTVRTRWVYERLEEAGSVLARGKSWTIELVEDLDLHTTGQSTSLRTEAAGRPSPQEESQRETLTSTSREPTPSTLPSPPPMGRVAATRNTIKPDPQLPLDLIGDLTIVERPTAPTADPPSLAPVSAPPTSTSVDPNPILAPQIRSLSTPSKRAPNAILGEQSKLAQTVLKASKAINPEPQINPDSEDEGEHAEVEWEKEVGLDWGSEGEEDVWAAMREARQIADEGDGQLPTFDEWRPTIVVNMLMSKVSFTRLIILIKKEAHVLEPPSHHASFHVEPAGADLFNASVKDVPLPHPGPNEAIVKVHYCAQNPTDWKYHANAHPGVIFGFDFSGAVVSLPPDARNRDLQVGDRVAGVVHGGLYVDEGSFAEYLKVETDLLFKVPNGMAMDEAATFGVAYVTAVQAIVQRQKNAWPPSNSRNGEWFLVYGASSSVGLFAVQIAKMVGYRVMAVCSPHNFDLVRALGADEVVSYRDSDAVERLQNITGGGIRSGLDTIAEGDSFRISVGAFGREGGKLSVILGIPDEARRIRPEVDLEFLSMYTLFGKEFKFTPSKDEDPSTFKALPEDRALHVEIGKRTPDWISNHGLRGNPIQMMGGLDDILDGFKYMAEGKVSGKKLVYKVADDA